MWFRKRSYPAKADLVLNETWEVAQGKHGGKPMFVRVNKGVSEAIGHPEFGHHVGVAVPLREPDENGLPGTTEIDTLNEIEDLLTSRLEQGRQCLHVVTITTGGMREFVFYSSDPAATHALLNDLQGEVTSHQIQHIIQPDPKWNVYLQFA